MIHLNSLKMVLVAPQPSEEGYVKVLNISDIWCFFRILGVRQNAQSTPIQQGSKRDLVEQD